MAVLVVVLFAAIFIVLFFALVFIPTWFVRSLHCHRMWRLRDQIAFDILDGRLDGQHPAVRQLLLDATRTASMHHEISTPRLIAAVDVQRRLSPAAKEKFRQELRPLPTTGLLKEQEELVVARRRQSSLLDAESVLLGSWLGVAMVLLLLPKAFIARRRHQRAHGSLSGDATKDALGSTPIGRRALRTAQVEAYTDRVSFDDLKLI
jgi:hypothetical protein